MDVVDVVPGCIQLYKRNYSHVSQGCLVQRGNNIIGNVQVLHVAVKPAIHNKIVPVTGYLLHVI
jgi:hypothetical protein